MEEPKKKKNLKPLWIGLAFAVLIIITFGPNSGSLPVAGQRSLVILGFAVTLWVNEAVSYPVSTAIIIAITGISIGHNTANIRLSASNLKMSFPLLEE